jgi:hypothetical protein
MAASRVAEAIAHPLRVVDDLFAATVASSGGNVPGPSSDWGVAAHFGELLAAGEDEVGHKRGRGGGGHTWHPRRPLPLSPQAALRPPLHRRSAPNT